VDDTTGVVTVVQPNEDGSYWRKIVRNKMIRMKEKRRLQAAEAFASEELRQFVGPDETFTGKVVSSWGPYTSIVGTATKTGVAGLTAEAELTKDALTKAMSAEEADSKWTATGESLAAAFRKIDTDGSGSLSLEELSEAIRAINPDVTDAEVEGLVSNANVSGTGEVTLQEFVMLMLGIPQQAAQPA